MTEKQSKDYTKMLEDLSKPYGCYGIKTVMGFSGWIDHWVANGGDENALDGMMMIVDKSTGHMSLWVTEEVLNER